MGSHRNRGTDQHGHEIPFAQALDAGHASFRLAGHRLHGDRALTRFRRGSDGEREPWLLVRRGHTAKGGTPDPRRARSARSGRTPEQVAAEEEPA
ncbi:hypothetical protein [Streptomyces sp. NPDC004284]|uniref:hypothetical protein n=1 Tax=Streptomyces sp. NPDC004284 TaxID=3364695 RepID=UPI0036B6C3C0